MVTSSAGRVKELFQRRLDAGLSQVRVWVPKKRREEIQHLAWQMRVKDKIALRVDCLPERPDIEIPTVAIERPESPLVEIKSSSEEVWLHKLLRVNGGEWDGGKKVWLVRQDVVKALGLGPRMNHASGFAHHQTEDEAPTLIEYRPGLPGLP